MTHSLPVSGTGGEGSLAAATGPEHIASFFWTGFTGLRPSALPVCNLGSIDRPAAKP